MKNHIIKYDIPSDFNVEVKTLYKGKLAESDLFERYPELNDIYPTRVSVVRKYQEVKRIADEEQKTFTMFISENGIDVIENTSKKYNPEHKSREPIIQNSIDHFSFKKFENIEIKIYNKGKIIDDNFLKQHPNIYKIYPSRLDVYKKIYSILQNDSKSKFVIKITETTVEVI